MTPVTAGKVKYGVWALSVGHHCHDPQLCLVVGPPAARPNDGEEAVLRSAAICFAQFMKDPNHQEHLQAIGN